MKRKPFSAELEILVELIRIVILRNNSSKLESLLENKIDWERFSMLCSQHEIRLIAHTAFSLINYRGIPDYIRESLSEFVLSRTLVNLKMTREAKKIIKNLEEAGLRARLYKGVLFNDRLYKGLGLREMHDIDIIVHPDDFSKVYRHLLGSGFELVNYEKNVIVVPEITPEDINRFELSLKKTGDHSVSIDLHYSLYPSFLQYKVPVEEFFMKDRSDSEEYVSMLLMMLIHHGGRELWRKLKFMADWLTLYANKPSGLPYEALEKITSEYKISTAYQTGNYLINEFFGFDINRKEASVKESTLRETLESWEVPAGTVKPARGIIFGLIKLRSYLRIKDSGGTFRLIKEYFIYLSRPNVNGLYRFYFPPKHYILNFFIRLFSVLKSS